MRKPAKNPLLVFGIKTDPSHGRFCLAMQVLVDLFFSKPHLCDQLVLYHVSQNILIYLTLILERYRAEAFSGA